MHSTSIVLSAVIDPNGVWRLSLFICLALTMAAFIWAMPKEITKVGKILWCYVLLYALTLFEYPKPFYGVLNRAFEASAGQTFAEALIFPLGALFFGRYIKKALPYLVIVECFCLWKWNVGFMRAYSFDTAFIALCLPFVHPVLWIAGVLTILRIHGSTALMMLAVQVVAFCILKRRWGILTGITIAFGSFIFGYGHAFSGAEPRFEAWIRFMRFWAHNKLTMAFGNGAGSFTWLSLIIDDFQTPAFLSMHSDWLQITFDTGIVGVSLAFIFAMQALWKVRRNSQLLPAVLGAVTFGMTYHPLRFAPSALVTALIFKLALIEKEVHFEVTKSGLPS